MLEFGNKEGEVLNKDGDKKYEVLSSIPTEKLDTTPSVRSCRNLESNHTSSILLLNNLRII
jgi:hypothetical protein